MGAIQLSHIKTYIYNTFKDYIDLADARTSIERDALLLTRGLAAMALQITSGISAQNAAISITDGFNDCGIDAIYNDITRKEIIFVQSKWSDNGDKTISQGDNLKFINGLRNIIKSDFSKFNEKIKNRSSEITSFLYGPNYTAKFVVAHVSNDSISAHCFNDIESFISEMNDTSELFSFDEINQRKLHGFVRNEGEQDINIDIDIYDFVFSSGERKVFYGKVSANSIADWKESSKTSIFDKNIRTFLGETAINTAIVASLRHNQEDFMVLNNGITIICRSISDTLAGAGNRSHKRLTCNGVQIVNGAQTVGACHKAKYRDGVDLSSAYVIGKIIEVGEDDSLADHITRSTNTQNKIERKDFVSLDEIQKNLRISFSLLGIDYLIKSGEASDTRTDTITLEEATFALIMQKNDIELAALAKREIGKIWEKLDSKNYTSLFNSSVEAVRLCGLVKIFRNIELSVGKHAEFHGIRGKGYSIHGNVFIALQIFDKINFEEYQSKPCEEQKFIVQSLSGIVFSSIYFIGEREYGGCYLAHLFRNAAKCRDIATKINEPFSKLLPYKETFTMDLAVNLLSI